MRITRTLTYEGTEADVREHLRNAKAPGKTLHNVGLGVKLHVYEAPAEPGLPVAMPDPMPGMIVEDSEGTRCSIAVCSRSSDGQRVIHLLMFNKLRAGLQTVDIPWDSPTTVRVYSAAGVLLWERGADPVETGEPT